jgi:hypothetical protein
MGVRSSFVGTLLFTLVALPAIGLNFFVGWLEKVGVSALIQWGLLACEYLLFVVDALLFAVFIVRQAWKGLVSLWLLTTVSLIIPGGLRHAQLKSIFVPWRLSHHGFCLSAHDR